MPPAPSGPRISYWPMRLDGRSDMKRGLAAGILLAQTLSPSARAVINISRSLTQSEVAQVLAATREALAGRTVRMSYQPGGPGPEMLMAADGRPRFVRTVSGYASWSGWTSSQPGSIATTTRQESRGTATEVTEFTRRPVRRCDGSPADGELVIEYRNEDERGWMARARTRTPTEFAATIFDMLTGAAASESGERRQFGGRWARAFAAP